MSSTATRSVTVVDLGLRPYAEVWEFQKQLLERVAAGESGDVLLLCEHPAVITLGRKATVEADVLDAARFPIFPIERGGEATYHAPGQIVGYPILYLEEAERDLHRVLRNLEEINIRALARHGVEACRRPGLTGVWVGDRKVTSVGLAVRKWITYHGFALNVSNDVSGFEAIRPCGLTAEVMTSVESLVGRPVALEEVKRDLVIAFAEVFSRKAIAGDVSLAPLFPYPERGTGSGSGLPSS